MVAKVSHNITLFSLLLLLTGCFSNENSQAFGTLEREQITFSATANEIIRDLPIREGSLVNIGDVLIQFDTKYQSVIVTKAIAEKAKANAYLQRLMNGERAEDIAASKARVDRAEALLIEAEKSFSRTQELIQKNVISQSEVDSSISNRDSAKAKLTSTEEEFAKLTAGSRPEDIEQAQASLNAASANVMLQNQLLDDLTITATRKGILDSLPYHLGERVPLNSTVAIIQGDSLPYARVYVPAAYRLHFIPNKKVPVYIDGIEKPFVGTIRWVASAPSYTPYYALSESERSRLMYLAEVDLDDSAHELPAGIPIQIELNLDALNEQAK